MCTQKRVTDINYVCRDQEIRAGSGTTPLSTNSILYYGKRHETTVGYEIGMYFPYLMPLIQVV